MEENDKVVMAKKFIVTCPCCKNEIVSPRGEVAKMISDNARKINACKEKITKINEKIKNTTLAGAVDLRKNRKKLVEELQELNAQSNIYKRKRQVLSEHESISAYYMLKKVIVEKYGERVFIDCMNEVMKRVDCEQEDTDMKVIKIV